MQAILETVLEKVVRESEIPTREVIHGADLWTQVGEFEATCTHCGEMIEPVVFMRNEQRRRAYLRRGDHECQASSEFIEERAISSALWALDNPDMRAISEVAKHVGLPRQFFAGIDRVPRHPHLEDALDAARGIVSHMEEIGTLPDRGLYLWSRESGTGKSSIAKALLFDLRWRSGSHCPPGDGWRESVLHHGAKLNAEYWTVPELLDEWAKSVRGEESRYWRSKMERANAIGLCDLGKESGTEARFQFVFELFDRACEQGQMVVITSQYAPRDLGARLGAIYPGRPDDVRSMLSRIKHLCRPVDCSGPSLRRSWP